MWLIDQIDAILNRITMYRVVLYYLIGLVAAAYILAEFKVLAFDPIHLLLSTLFLVWVCAGSNHLLAKFFKAPTNHESSVITALILTLVLDPASSLKNLLGLGLIAVAAMVSKYVLAINKKHMFNPVAIAIWLSSLVINVTGTWWVGNQWMTPLVLAGGLLMVRKIRREKMVWSYMGTAGLVMVGLAVLSSGNLMMTINQLIFHSSLLFMGFVMLTEPLTTPPTEKLQIIYGAIVGLLFVPGVHIGSFYSTPELALLLGNIFAYVVSPKEKLIMQVEEKIQLTKDTFDFVFKPEKRFSFAPGQYMEWTLPHEHPDNRGNRRYFTLASSPTEMDLRIGVKFYLPASSFKRALANLPSDQEISAAQRAGDFTLPANKKQKLVLIAGGIGVTPYRSMLKYLIDTKEKRDVVVVYSNREKEEIVYQDVLGEAEKKLGVRIVYTLTDEKKIPDNWQGGRGRINEDMITKNIPDYRDRLFYISGPFALVSSTEKMLLGMGLAKDQIKTDFFPGFV